MVGSITTCELVRAMLHRWAHSSRTSSWRMPTRPPLLQLSPCSSVRPEPHPSQWSGRSVGRRPYLMATLSSHSSLVSSVPENLSGMVESHAPVAVAHSINFLTFRGGRSMRAMWKATSPSRRVFRCFAPAAQTVFRCASTLIGSLRMRVPVSMPVDSTDTE